jgi:hypothetical protein
MSAIKDIVAFLSTCLRPFRLWCRGDAQEGLMTRSSKFVWVAGWSAPAGWLAAAVLFALWIAPSALAWSAGWCVLVALFGYLALHHVRSSHVPVLRHAHKHSRIPSWRNRMLTILCLASPAIAGSTIALC